MKLHRLLKIQWNRNSRIALYNVKRCCRLNDKYQNKIRKIFISCIDTITRFAFQPFLFLLLTILLTPIHFSANKSEQKSKIIVFLKIDFYDKFNRMLINARINERQLCLTICNPLFAKLSLTPNSFFVSC